MSAETDRAEASITGVSPQFLVEDLDRAIAWYRDRAGFTLDFQYEDFYASVSRDGYAIHLKHGPVDEGERAYRKGREHLDAFFNVSGVRALFAELEARGANVFQGLQERPWACIDFYVEDADGYILCFSESIG